MAFTAAAAMATALSPNGSVGGEWLTVNKSLQ